MNAVEGTAGHTRFNKDKIVLVVQAIFDCYCSCNVLFGGEK